MAVLHRASIAAATANPTTTFTAVIPSSVVANDVIYLPVESRDHTSGTALPTVTDNDTGGNTWALLGNTADRKLTVWWKRATSATASKTVTVAGCVGSASGGVSCYSGAIQSGNPFSGVVVETNAAADETHASFVNSDPNAVICFIVANYANDNAVTSVSGATAGAFTQRFEKLSTGGSDCAVTLWDRTTSGSTGAITWAQVDGTTYSMAFKITPQPDFAGSQTAFGFYEDGTESGSAIIGSQDTNITRDVSSDSNLLVRFRVQETAGTAGESTDDYGLYCSKSGGAYNFVNNSQTLVDSYASGASDGNFTTAIFGYGQHFKGNGRNLASASFTLKKFGTPAGMISAKLYATTGIYGSTMTPTGAALATSTNSITANSLTTSFTAQIFTFDETFTLTAGTAYAIVVEHASSTATDYVIAQVHVFQATHAGNGARMSSTNVWTAESNYDYSFEVHSTNQNLPVLSTLSANLTEGAATTNRLGSGTGSFVAGKVSEDGEANDLVLTASNYTELLYSITLKEAQLANNDTLDFRVYRNGAALNAYSVTPRITVSKSGGVVTKKDGMFFGAA